MDIKTIAIIILTASIAGVISCCYFSGRQFEMKDYKGALGLLGCAAVFFATILGILL